MDELHFLRPWWWAALPIGAWLIWQLLRGRADAGGWRRVVAANLRAYVLAEPEVFRDNKFALVAALAAWFVAVAALAGPAWERLPVPAFRSDEALVVALDLSRSMDAGDVEPSRLGRAKLKLLDLVERRAAGQTALVVFSTHAFTVTPLTTDTRTIASLATALSTDIMPTPGGSIAAGLAKAGALLRQTGVDAGDILLITDSEVVAADVDLAGDLAGEGFRVSVLAVGTEQGAPIPQAEGGFVNDANGRVVVPQLEFRALQRLASEGGGRYARLAPDDRDLETLFPTTAALALEATLGGGGDEERYEVDAWRDRGAMLALLLLPFLALSFRRGWICLWLVVFVLPAPPAMAFEWQDLWQRADQRGYDALAAEEAQRAADLFENPEWRSAAQYRAGDFEGSAATLSAVDSAQGHYNRGNALAKAGKIEGAIGAYDQALALVPEHADARYNRELLQQYLEDNQPPPEEQQDQEQNQGEGGESNGDDGGEQQPGEQASEQGGQGEQGQPGDQQQGQGNAEPAPPENEGEAQAANEGEPGETNAQQSAPGPEDVEEWASEQAAEQWLRRVPQDPGGLLRRKFLYQYQRLGVDQDGNSVLEANAGQRPW